MTVQKSDAAGDISGARPQSLMKVFWWLFSFLIVGFIVYHAKVGPDSPRIANPNVAAADLAVVGIDLAWWCNVWTCIIMAVGGYYFAKAWQKQPYRPELLMLIAATALVWQDPIANWVSYSVFSPKLWHYPVDWPWVSVAPMVEPFVCIAYATVLIGPYFPAIAILRRMQARTGADAFVWRHPLITLGALTCVIGFILDAIVEITCTSARVYTYAQVPTFGSVFTGRYNQFPLLWESGLATAVMIPGAVLLYRDDTGRTQAEKLAQRLRLFPSRPALASFLIMFAALNLAYFCIYTGGFVIIRAGGFATNVACPWPYPDTKVYDPQGFYEHAGHPGPFYEGRWNTWMSGQPDGRPVIDGPTSAGRCGPGHS
jgi:hypothetical protein